MGILEQIERAKAESISSFGINQSLKQKELMSALQAEIERQARMAKEQEVTTAWLNRVYSI